MSSSSTTTNLLFQSHITLLAYRTAHLLNQIINGGPQTPSTSEVDQLIGEAREAANIASQLGILSHRQPSTHPVAIQPPPIHRPVPFRSIVHIPTSPPVHRNLLSEFNANEIRRTGRSNVRHPKPDSDSEDEEDGEIPATPESHRPPSYRSPSPEY